MSHVHMCVNTIQHSTTCWQQHSVHMCDNNIQLICVTTKCNMSHIQEPYKRLSYVSQRVQHVDSFICEVSDNSYVWQQNATKCNMSIIKEPYKRLSYVSQHVQRVDYCICLTTTCNTPRIKEPYKILSYVWLHSQRVDSFIWEVSDNSYVWQQNATKCNTLLPISPTKDSHMCHNMYNMSTRSYVWQQATTLLLTQSSAKNIRMCDDMHSTSTTVYVWQQHETCPLSNCAAKESQATCLLAKSPTQNMALLLTRSPRAYARTHEGSV